MAILPDKAYLTQVLGERWVCCVYSSKSNAVKCLKTPFQLLRELGPLLADVEPEFNDIAILDDVFFAFDAEFSNFFGGVL